jgi:putative spermidine/putrescine transport system substrate-binding protein
MYFRSNFLFLFIILFFTNCTQERCNGTGKGKLEKIGNLEDELFIIAWPGYVEKGETDPRFDWVTSFEKETGCRITLKTAETSDEMVVLMNEGGFDLVTASGDASIRLIRGNKVQEINTNLIPSWHKVDERLKSATWHTVEDKHYGVPYQWGANVLMYNTNIFKSAPNSWKVVFQEMRLPDGKSNKNRVQGFDGPIYIADAALYLMDNNRSLGIKNPYELDEKQFQEALKLLKEQRRIVPKYWHDPAVQIKDFKTGGFVASSAWPFQVNILKSGNEPIDSVVPKEGATGWADTTMLHVDSKHPNCAYKWLEHSITNKVQGDLAAWFGSVPANLEACKGNVLLTENGCKINGLENFQKIWFWRTPETNCGKNRKCVPYYRWVTEMISVLGGQ